MSDSSMCSIEGCDRSKRARGWCATHYKRWTLYGDPFGFHPKTMRTPRQRFESYVDRTSKECHEWIGHKTPAGYGDFKDQGKTWLAPRWEWFQAYGPLPKTTFIRHRCDNPACVRLDHLTPGTAKQNSQDMVERGRSSFGTRNARAKLTEEQALEALMRSRNGERYVSIAKDYGVTPENISMLANGKTWKHLHRA